MNVLLVEDHVDSGQILTKILSRDYCVTWLKCESEAFRELETHRYDCIISDIGLGLGGCGLSLINRVRASSLNADTPAVALSGYGMSEDVAASLAAGFCHHVLKPVDSVGLLEVINRVTRRSDGVHE